MHILFYVGIIIMAGLLLGHLASYLNLPHITGYLFAGVIIGPSALGLIPRIDVVQLSIISEIALGFIAYSIGCEFKFSNLKKTGKNVVIITLFQAAGAVLLVDLVLIYVFKQPVPFSIILGAIATATAPGPILLIVKQYKAKGPVVDTLLPLVALDDALGVVIFGICTTIAGTLSTAGAEMTMVKMVLVPFKEILFAFGIGLLCGMLVTKVIKRVQRDETMLCVIVAMILICVGLSHYYHVSPILSNMIFGATVCNMIPNLKNIRILHLIEYITPPIYVAFFTLAGAELDLAMLTEVGRIGIVYIIMRMIGKIAGSYIGGVVAKAPNTVRNYLGFTLIPQAGVAIGMAMAAESVLAPSYAQKVRSIILAATIVYELIGPILAKKALIKAGEVNCSELPNQDTEDHIELETSFNVN